MRNTLTYTCIRSAGVDFKVSFHGVGTPPPCALHIEAHQDSMGICLYLAQEEELTEGYIDLIIPDDVIMGVDAPIEADMSLAD